MNNYVYDKLSDISLKKCVDQMYALNHTNTQSSIYLFLWLCLLCNALQCLTGKVDNNN